MAIVECGFPFGLTIFGQPPIGAKAALSLRGPTVLVDIGFDPAFFGKSLPDEVGGTSTPTLVPSVQVPALIDTGASESCIDEQLAQQLQLPLIDAAFTSGIGGSVSLNIYLAHISIPGLVTEYGRFTGVHLQAGGQFHRAFDRTKASGRCAPGLRWSYRPGKACPLTRSQFAKIDGYAF